VQADPIRAPARAQDLTLRHRVANYRAGDLERRYPRLDLDEGFFVNHGFMRRGDYRLMLPRTVALGWTALTRRRARDILAFIRDRGEAHPREVLVRFAHGSTTNYWGRSSNAATHLLNQLHYRGQLRVVRRDAGVRVYALQDALPVVRDPATRRARLDALVNIMMRVYAPLPSATLAWLVGRLRYATPQWASEVGQALKRAKTRFAHAHVAGTDWFWPADEDPTSRRYASAERVYLLSPFDPVVWDRRRFEQFWGWAYRFEAYTPAHKRKLGYYALPVLWRGGMVGWANATRNTGRLECGFGFAESRPRDLEFERELEAEISRLDTFLKPEA